MASNPLYPGYVPTPKDAPINPLYPGYFPGQAAARIPRGPDIKPNEFNFDQITQIIDAVSADYMLAGPDLPRWAVDRAIDDFKQTLKVSIRPSNVKAEDLDDYDANALPGAFGVGLNLNPMDWINDPGKEASKTIKSWAKNGLNWHDLETRYRTETWNQVFNETGPKDFKYGASEEFATYMLGANVGAAVGLNYEKTANPLRLRGRSELIVDDLNPENESYKFGDMRPVLDTHGNVTGILPTTATAEKGKVDLGKVFGNSISEFEVMDSFAPTREVTYKKVIKDGYRVIATDLEKNAAIAGLTAAGSPYKDVIETGAKNAMVRANLMDSMSGIGKEFDDYLKEAKKSIIKTGHLELDEPLEDLNYKVRRHLTKIETQLSVSTETDFLKTKYFNDYTGKVEALLKNPILQLAEEAKNNPARRTAIEAQIKGMGANKAINAINGQVDGGFFSKPLSKGSAISQSIEGEFFRDTMATVTHPGAHKESGVGQAVSVLIGQDKTAASQVVLGGMNMIRNEAQIMGQMEIFDALENGKFLERYIWPRVKVYIQSSTPGAYAEKFLKKNHYFGLDLSGLPKEGKGIDAAFEKTVMYRAANAMQQPFGASGAKKIGSIASGAAPNAIYGNWFTVRYNDKATGIHINAKFYGGAHFDAIDKLDTLMKSPGWNDAHLLELLNVKDANGIAALATKLSGVKLPGGIDAGDPASLAKWADEIKSFKEWLDKNEHRVHVSGISKTDPEYYAKLIKALNAKNINADFKSLGITRRYAGQLQKLYFKLNATQSAIYNKFGKILAPLAYARKIIVDFLATLVTKALQIIGGAATGGALAAFFATIEPLIRFIINVVVGKAMEIAKVFYDAIIKADIDSVFKYVDKSAEKYGKIMLIIAGFFVALVVIPGEKFMGAVSTSFSPVDNTLSAGIGDLFDPSGGSGSGIVVPSLAIKPSSVYGFQFLDMPDTEIVNNLGTFKLTAWDPKFRNMIDEAIKELQLRTGGYLGRLSDPSVGGLVNIVWAEPMNGGVCGAAFGTDFLTGNDTIVMGHGNCYHPNTKQWYMNYLFAHESAHIYNYRYNGEESFDGIFFSSVTSGGEGTLPTYNSECSDSNSVSEDFAETLGNWVQLNTASCSDPSLVPTGPGTAGDPCSTEFWKKYPKHCEYADKVLTRP